MICGGGRRGNLRRALLQQRQPLENEGWGEGGERGGCEEGLIQTKTARALGVFDVLNLGRGAHHTPGVQWKRWESLVKEAINIKLGRELRCLLVARLKVGNIT